MADATHTTRLRALLLDDDPTIVAAIARALEREGYEAVGAGSLREARSALSVFEPDLAIIDVFLGGENGLDFVRELRRLDKDIGIVVISAEDTEVLAQKAMDSGADYFLSKPVSPAALLLTAQRIRELIVQRRKALDLRLELQRSLDNQLFPEIVTNCDAMKAVLRLVEKVGGRDLAVLVCGESGVGKELIAQAIHARSARRSGPFVELNCAALPPNLVESELFGHEKGAFTGAIASRTGKIQQASGGTLFLDEIGELPLEIQPKLLRALQEKVIIPVGGKQPVYCDFRLISATNRDLVEETREGRFREDLFYRVAVFPIKIPALRQRIEDLELLLAHFLRQEGIERPRITSEARALLASHSWPGNVRELRNFAQAIPLYCESGVIDGVAVHNYFGARLELPAPDDNGAMGERRPARPVRRLEDLRREEIRYALERFEGNITRAAEALGMGRATLYKYMKRNGMER